MTNPSFRLLNSLAVPSMSPAKRASSRQFSALFLVVGIGLLAVGCGAKHSIDLAPAEGPDSKGSHGQTTSEYCKKTNLILTQMGLDQAKKGLDRVVTSLTPQDSKNLILGAKIYRRGSPTKLSDKTIRAGTLAVIGTLERAGQSMQMLGLVLRAPHFEKTSNPDGQIVLECPAPRSDRNPATGSRRDLYDGIPTYGIGYGQNTADAGFVIASDIMAKIQGTWFEAQLTYTGVTENYALTLASWTSGGAMALALESCGSSAEMVNWTRMPIEQHNMNECENKSCTHLPK